MSVTVDLDNLISVSDASRRGVSSLVTEAEQGREWIVLRGSKPVAGVVGIETVKRLRRLEQIEHEMSSLMVVVARLVTEADQARPVTKLVADLGLSPGDLISPSDA